MNTKLSIILTACLLATGCSSTFTKKEEMKTIGEINAPSWYLKEDTIFSDTVVATATETSSNMQYAVDKATFSAQVSLANTINSKVNSVSRSSIRERDDSTSGVSDVESDRVAKITINQYTSFFTRTKVQVYKEGSLYRAFVKLEIPLDAARKLVPGKNAPLVDRYKELEKNNEVQ